MSPGKQPDPARKPDKPMTTVERTMSAGPEQVWAVLSDGWLYPVWVVGATHMRDVDRTWPAPGAKLHHQVGAWPMMLSDTTEVVGSEPKRQLVLQGRAWPAGEVRIELTIEAHPEGSLVRMGEAPTHGPAHFMDNPLQRKVLSARNRESLNRLASIVENR
jgi:uncharacterized protein YndB with AHSA1/START domain